MKDFKLISMVEEFRPIKGYEGIYEVSNIGRIKSLDRTKRQWRGGHIRVSEKILKTPTNPRGYNIVSLSREGKCKTFNVYLLVAFVFLNHNPISTDLVVDHIDNNKSNDCLDNLQLITHRENSTKDRKRKSKYRGVSWHSRHSKWIARIQINGKRKYLGSYIDELEASRAYELELSILTETAKKQIGL